MSDPTRLEPRPPDLRFVPVESIFPHEQFEESRLEQLAERLRSQKVLKNPPIVTPLNINGPEEPRFVVLDGANRSTAARMAGFRHMLVQVVRYQTPDVMLSTWSHGLSEASRTDLEGSLCKLDGLMCRSTDMLHARALLARRDAIAYVCYEDASATTLHGKNDLHVRNKLLNAIVDLYRLKESFNREPTDSFAEAKSRHPSVSALVVFPHFEPAEILELTAGGDRLPAGISRHLVQWRALRVNIPLEKLADTSHSTEQKNAWLADWLRQKSLQRQVRYYEEPTVLFDE